MEAISENRDILHYIEIILAENGETRLLTLFRPTNPLFSKKKNRINEPLIFDHKIIDSKVVLRLPLTLNLHVSLIIDWGDGNIIELKNNDDFLLHVVQEHWYENIKNGTYRVKIYNTMYGEIKIEKSVHLGHLPRWADNITDFITIGRIGITELDWMFSETTFNGGIRQNWGTSMIVNVRSMFRSAYEFDQEVGNNWNTENVLDMSQMFYAAHSFNQKIGENWNTRNVRDISGMFWDATNFNQKIGENWDTRNVRNMRSMFADAASFNQKIGENWNTWNVRDMSWMFANTPKFNQKIGENWDTQNVRNMNNMFCHAERLNQLLGQNWDTQNVRNMSWMFANARSFNQKIGENWDTQNVRNMNWMFYNAQNFNQKIGENWDTSKADTKNMFGDATKLEVKNILIKNYRG